MSSDAAQQQLLLLCRRLLRLFRAGQKVREACRKGHARGVLKLICELRAVLAPCVE